MFAGWEEGVDVTDSGKSEKKGKKVKYFLCYESRYLRPRVDVGHKIWALVREKSAQRR